MTDTELESKRKKWNLAVKVIGLLVLGFVVAPFIFTAIQGLIGLAIAAGICLVGNYYLPVLADKMANWRIQLIKAEAAKNPIETLQNDYADRQDKLVKFKESIEKFSASTMDFEDKLDGFKKDYPDDAPKFDKQLQQMKDLLEVRKDKYKDAVASLKLFAGVIKRADAIWQMTQAAITAGKAAGMTDQDFMSKLKTDTALDSVTTSMNVAFSDLELSLAEEKDQKILKLGTGTGLRAPVVEADVVESARVKARR